MLGAIGNQEQIPFFWHKVFGILFVKGRITMELIAIFSS
jgi:hypothetical protein